MPEPLNPTVLIERCTGAALRALVEPVAALRVRVFCDFPYLYDGEPAYEAEYLRTYLASPRSAIIVARQDGRIVGASTCVPLADETENVQAPFRAHGWRVEDFFYFGESVLLPECRGQGVGVAFFREREAHARAVSDCDHACFCAVVRAPDHPARPADYVALDKFWRRRGFVPRPDLSCTMRWRDLGEAQETAKTLTFWVKSLHGAVLP